MNFANIKYCDIANGEGVRTSLFVSGCRRHCPGCFNEAEQKFDAGNPFDTKVQNDILESLKPDYIDGLTILGGEPMEPENQAGLVEFVEHVRKSYPDKSIWCYTGNQFESLLTGGKYHTEVTDRLLDCFDVMVDGAFVQSLYSVNLRFRGSSNQRIIDVKKTRTSGKICLWSDDPVYATHSMEVSAHD